MISDDVRARLLAGTADVIPRDELDTKLALDRPLRVKLGVDPSRPDLTLGHAVVLRKLRQFQDAGHVAVLIIGDFTGLVGDPSGVSETRPMLTREEIAANAATYLEQAGAVVGMARAEVRYNSEWLGKMRMDDVLGLCSRYTVARMLERDDFSRRLEGGQPITVAEFLYPLMQAMDSVAVRADVELGGTDQTFNLLVGREIQRAYGHEPQVVMTMPLLLGLDGERKMSKSLRNYVALTEPADEMFGKLMSIPDDLIVQYLELCASMPPHELERVRSELGSGELRPDLAKRRMARGVVELYHGTGSGAAAEERFDAVHRRHEVPPDVPEVAIPAEVASDGTIWLPRLLHAIGLASSNAEGRRRIEGGGVRLDGEVLDDPQAELSPEALRGKVLQVGRRRFVRLT